ncbi:zf-HC2 domain-containing protein [Novosphingobium sp. G106]|uniref:zf-HC2 domain-containing protein n=1 Tax=Novosphingobium sp. G106 TaxID=2849500 RepID=UPI001C2DA50E|nr:zf-HC2 domain-containing protein [Novosphingobium sp. G106]MBV1691328.1 zf-HC2 domain-containing protein [Novosphingobium sp. G106]
MGKIIGFGSDRHRQVQEALPWYVTDRLAPAERAEVDDHLATCAACRRELAAERELAAHVVSLPINADAGWEAVRRQMHGRAKDQSPRPVLSALKDLFQRPTHMGWVLASQIVVIVAAGTVYMALPRQPAAEYHVLSASPAPRAGNVIAMFRPDVSEQQLRTTLLAHGAVIVDGPTVAGAYILRVPENERAKTLAEFQRSKDLVLAQPIDSQPAP